MTDFEQLQENIRQRLWKKYRKVKPNSNILSPAKPSAVLLIIVPEGHGLTGEPCLILNKRSDQVKQGGDLCCPGGGLSRIDPLLAKIIQSPVLSLLQHLVQPGSKLRHSHATAFIYTMLAAGLREAFEEMRLNPLRANFLGPVPPQPLVTFDRIVYPLCVNLMRPVTLKPNWEVKTIIPIPLRHWLNPDNYANYHLTFPRHENFNFLKIQQSYPCFKLPDNSDLVWGVTYRIVITFLDIVFGFKPPDGSNLPVIQGELPLSYITGLNKQP